jgi:hypothetical protein
VGIHFIPNLHDGQYGNARSWIGQSGDPGFAGVRLGGLKTVSSIAFGRDNQEGPQFDDRYLGNYTVQYTKADSPSVSTPDCDWKSIGRVTYAPDLCPLKPWMRHRYNFASVDATAVRILVPGTGFAGGTAIDELEVYAAPGELTAAPCPASEPFVRGDANGDGLGNISDPIALLGSLFLGTVTLFCEKSADFNDDGKLNITDAIAQLSFLFLGGDEPKAPVGACGQDPTPDSLGCEAFSPCR